MGDYQYFLMHHKKEWKKFLEELVQGIMLEK